MQSRTRASLEKFGLSGQTFRWDLDPAQIAFVSAECAVVADLCMVGSVTACEKTFLWAWANETIPAGAQERLLDVRAFGTTHDLRLLTTAEWPATDAEGLEMLAVAERGAGCRRSLYRQSRRSDIVLRASSIPHPAPGRRALADRPDGPIEDDAMDTSELATDLLAALEKKGWTIRRSAAPEPLLPPPLRERYPRLPADLTGFLEALESCVSAEETVWFLCPGDYRVGPEAFRWNEYELMSLETTDDPGEQKEIRRFWDLHLPFMLAVHSDYDYMAVSLAEETYGQIVHGCGDDFEAPSPVAASFAEFLSLLKEEAAGATDGYPLSYFL
jgi:hypothetical protein